MSTFKSTREDEGHIRIERRIADTPIYIELRDGAGRTAVALFDPADAPAMALAVLEAGDFGQSPVAELLRGSIKAAQR